MYFSRKFKACVALIAFEKKFKTNSQNTQGNRVINIVIDFNLKYRSNLKFLTYPTFQAPDISASFWFRVGRLNCKKISGEFDLQIFSEKLGLETIRCHQLFRELES